LRGGRAIVRELNRITLDALVTDGKPCIRGLRILAVATLLTLVLILSTAADALANAQRELPPRFEATFSLKTAGATFARSQWSLAPEDGGRFVSTSRTEPTGMFSLIRDDTRVERSEWAYAGDWLQPIRYRYERTGRKTRVIDITFDWEKNTARHESGGTTWQLEVPPGTMDKFSYILALMRDLELGARRMEYTIADGGRHLKRYVLTGVGEERIETALGTLDTVVIRRERENSARRTTFWCAKSLGHFPVKIVHTERDDATLTLQIESLSGIERRNL